MTPYLRRFEKLMQFGSEVFICFFDPCNNREPKVVVQLLLDQ